MKARLRAYFDAEQWDGSDDEARRLGLIHLRVGHVPSLSAWHLPTDDGPVMLATGDWILTHPADGQRLTVRRADFPRLYEVL